MNEARKREVASRRQFAFRLNLFFFTIFILFSILIVRLAILQFVHSEELQAAKVSSSTKTTSIPPIRGNIYDRNGHVIAISTSTQSLYFQIQPGTTRQAAEELAHELAEVFYNLGTDEYRENPMDADRIIQLMDLDHRTHYSYMPRRIKTDLSDAEVAYFLENKDKYSMLEILEESIRNYDPNGYAVQLVGYLRQFRSVENLQGHLSYYNDPERASQYLQSEAVGYDGLEFMYQEVLRGKNGYKTYPVSASGRIIGNVSMVPPVKGDDLYLTIDTNVQEAAENAIREHLEVLRTHPDYVRINSKGVNATTGYAVAMEVDTGNVVAMASIPDYDPNVWRGGSISAEDWQKNQYYTVNGTISEAYPNYDTYEERAKHPTSLVYLGSTIKPLTILIGLKEGLITPEDTYYDTGSYTFGRDNSTIRNASSRFNGSINAYEALVRSSNTYMAAMVGNPLYEKYGRQAIDVWDAYMEQFGLGVRTGSGLPMESRGIKDYLNIEAAGSVQASLVFASWGQMGKYTPLQLAQFSAMLANKGKRMKPQFVKEIRNYQGELIRSFEPEVLNEAEFKEEWWDLIHRAMEQVWIDARYPIEIGIGKKLEELPVRIAAKTGTSTQQVWGGDTVDNAVVIAYAPADKPKLAVAVVVPEGGYGAWGAAPIAAKIFESYAEHIGFD